MVDFVKNNFVEVVVVVVEIEVEDGGGYYFLGDYEVEDGGVGDGIGVSVV